MLRILICDAYADAAESTALLLRLLGGYECAVARSVAEVIELTSRFAPDVALMELPYRGGDNSELIRHLSERGVILIALTGFTDDLHRRKAAEAGFQAYLVKPARFEELNAVLSGLAPARLNGATST